MYICIFVISTSSQIDCDCSLIFAVIIRFYRFNFDFILTVFRFDISLKFLSS